MTKDEATELPRDWLCQCGCGLPAPVSTKTDRWNGYVVGQPKKYIKGHHLRKLTDAQIAEIRCSAESQTALAKRYGVTQPTISDIILKKGRYGHDEG